MFEKITIERGCSKMRKKGGGEMGKGGNKVIGTGAE